MYNALVLKTRNVHFAEEMKKAINLGPNFSSECEYMYKF